jgi:thioredoxin 1
MTTDLTPTSFETHVIANQETWLIDFWSPSCGPCRKLSPILDGLGKEFNIGKVNCYDHLDFVRDHDVAGLPTLVWFKNGVEVRRMIGLQDEATLRRVFAEIG